MAQPNFDPSGFYEFDLSRGAVRTRDGERVFVLSDDVVAPLINALVKQGDLSTLTKLGERLGSTASASLAGRVSELSPEQVIGHAAAVLALYGWGRLQSERWGDAFVVTITGLRDLDPMQLATSALLSGLLGKLAGAELSCVPVGDERFVVVHPSIAKQVSSWVTSGSNIGEIARRLVATEVA
ncbi:MAG: hypothetical protein IPK60_15750 [Sandaracinaceae bacterium]|jgi:hypothetical protein|nr:hypothetical protein [Sandaracinaceae bacterium]